jgi:phosphate transport system substrate-binding protein
MLTTLRRFSIFAASASFAFGSIARADLSGTISADGSSTVGPITMAVAEEFEKENPKVKPTIGISGTGGGFKRFTKGETDISNASRPIKKEEADIAKAAGVEFLELPIAFDGLTIVVNKNNSFLNKITLEQLKKIFTEGGAKNWSDVDPSFPNQPIKIFSPGTDSGTFDYFKEVVAGKEGKIRSDMSVSEDDNVLVRGVEGDQNAIGFFGCAYFFENKDKLKDVAVVNPKTQKEVVPTPETIKNGEYAPFSRPLFIYVNAKSLSKPEVSAFVDYYLDNAHDVADEVGYVGLPKEVMQLVKKNFKDKKLGTQFIKADGKHAEGALADIYK